MGILDLAPPGFLFVGSLGGEFFVLPLIPWVPIMLVWQPLDV
jgi:hypothetical protein